MSTLLPTGNRVKVKLNISALQDNAASYTVQAYNMQKNRWSKIVVLVILVYTTKCRECFLLFKKGIKKGIENAYLLIKFLSFTLFLMIYFTARIQRNAKKTNDFHWTTTFDSDVIILVGDTLSKVGDLVIRPTAVNTFLYYTLILALLVS